MRRYGVLPLMVTLCRQCSSKSNKGFKSTSKFKLSPSEVNETNAPSVKELNEIIPSVKDLHEQLPSANELERKYVEKKPAPEKWKPEDESSHPIFSKTTDPFEDLLDAPKEDNKPAPEHLLLAYRALLYGTFYALVGFFITVVIAMYCCGYSSLAELMAGVRGKASRDEVRLIERSKEDSGQEEVVHYTIDLSNPAEALKEARLIWDNVVRMSNSDESD